MPPPSAGRNSTVPRRGSGWITLGFVIATAGLLWTDGCQRDEGLAWRIAAASEADLDADYLAWQAVRKRIAGKGDEAHSLGRRAQDLRIQAARWLDRPLGDSLEAAGVLALRAQYRLQAGQINEALADTGRLVQLARNDPAHRHFLRSRLQMRGLVYWRKGDFARAGRDFERVLSMSRGANAIDLAGALNSLAYLRAEYVDARLHSKEELAWWRGLVAGAVLEQGFEEANTAVKLLGSVRIKTQHSAVLARRDELLAAVLDTRATLLLFKGEPARALEDLNTALPLHRRMSRRRLKLVNSATADRRVFAATQLQDWLTEGEMLHHRSRCYAMLGQDDLAERDRRQAERLGYQG